MDTEYIRVSKNLADEYKKLESVEEQEAAVKRVIEKKRLDLDAENEMLGESLLQFKSVCLAHKKELEKVYQDQSDKIYAMWEDMGDVTTMVNQHARSVAAQIEPLKNEVAGLKRTIDELRRSLEGLHLYVPQQLAEVTTQIAKMDDKTKALLSILLNHNS